METRTSEQILKENLMKTVQVRRTLLNKGQLAPKGFIFYNIIFRDRNGIKKDGSRKISLKSEAEVGIDNIINALKDAVVEEYFKA